MSNVNDSLCESGIFTFSSFYVPLILLLFTLELGIGIGHFFLQWQHSQKLCKSDRKLERNKICYGIFPKDFFEALTLIHSGLGGSSLTYICQESFSSQGLCCVWSSYFYCLGLKGSIYKR